MSFEGLTDHDKHDDKLKAAMLAQPCKCVHGTEDCCEFETHEHLDNVDFFEAPEVGHRFHKAHYCISGDEPECEHLRKEEKEQAEKKRKKMEAEQKQKQQQQERAQRQKQQQQQQ